MPKKLLTKRTEIFDSDVIQRAERDGTEVEKGVVLTEEYLKAHEDNLRELIDLYTAYPDIYLDTIKPADSTFELFF